MILRPATAADAAALCDVINPLIAAGGTTAHRTPFTPVRMLDHYIAPPNAVSCVLAEDAGEVLGFQSLVRAGVEFDPIPADWGVIASFVRLGLARSGIAGRLFAATRETASAAGIPVIDATIRRENTGGLAYYARMGFRDYDATPTSLRKRFDLVSAGQSPSSLNCT